MKLMIIGYARHGKDTVCKLLVDHFGLSFVSSSYFVAEKAVRPALAQNGLVYPDLQTCYDDRVNHRADWFNAIAEYNKDDPARLGRELFAEYDIYCGNRNVFEFEAMKVEGAFDYAWWIDRSDLAPPEDKSSNTLLPEMADRIINNNGDMAWLDLQVRRAYCEDLKKLHLGS